MQIKKKIESNKQPDNQTTRQPDKQATTNEQQTHDHRSLHSENENKRMAPVCGEAGP
jgi:hypothetical protein